MIHYYPVVGRTAISRQSGNGAKIGSTFKSTQFFFGKCYVIQFTISGLVHFDSNYPNLIILNGTPAWYKYKLCTYFLIFLFRFFPLIREGLSSYEWITFLHSLTLSLWDTKKELSQICHLFSRVLLIFFIVIIIIVIIIITTQQSPLNLSHRYSLLNYLRNFVSLSSDCSEPRPIWTFQL